MTASTINSLRYEYGYAPAIEQAQMERSPAVWGARTITDPDAFGMLHDRQSWYSENRGANDALSALLNNGVLTKCQEEYRSLRSEHRDFTRVARELLFFEDDVVKVVGNTNGSCGYLYLAAFIKPGDLSGTWNGGVRPATGDTVDVKVNGIGEATALRCVPVHGVAGLWVRPLDPPAWYRKQNARGLGGWSTCWVTGPECAVRGRSHDTARL